MPTPAEITRAADRRDAVVTRIADALATRGYPPSIRELALDLAVSKRTIRVDLEKLVEAGRVEVDPGQARGIRLV